MFYNDKELFLEQTHSINNSELKRQDYVSETDNKKETTEHVKNIHSSEHISKSTVNDANTQVDITYLPVQVYALTSYNYIFIKNVKNRISFSIVLMYLGK